MLNRYVLRLPEKEVTRDKKEMLIDIEVKMYQMISMIGIQGNLLKQLVEIQHELAKELVELKQHVHACEENVAEIKRLLTEHVEFGPGTEFAQSAIESSQRSAAEIKK